MKINTRAYTTNLHCLCKTLDRQELVKMLDQTSELQEIPNENNFFSDTAIFLPPSDLLTIKDVIHSIERAARLDGFRNKVLEDVPEVARLNFGPKGVFMGYDFHLSETGPKVIEINTNAGGAYLNLLLAKAQIQCCPEVEPATDLNHLEEKLLEMFHQEWKLQGRKEVLRTVAIVDTKPQEQFLYPEFKLFQNLFLRNNINCMIVDPEQLELRDEGLYVNSQRVDLVYNRLTDFYMSGPQLMSLKRAYERGDVVITPNPHHHALFARKSNLQLLTDPAKLGEFGLSKEDIATLCQGIPETLRVSKENQDFLWTHKKRYFFKPISGFGSKAAYRGDKLTQRVWDEILGGEYIAQEFVKAPVRSIVTEGKSQQLKFDVRAYTYNGEILLLAARLYSGQTTNFRTVGGGFAPIYILE